ncbi:hypothetical protein JCM33374_g2308 [Metschnikowia sp. JCM 33374]|nr:hypothetical protein JCM33374_g2308 [Metschnikowia sp. JCM 33374]
MRKETRGTINAATVSGIASAKIEKAQAEAISDARLLAQVQRIQTQILILSKSLEKAVQTTDGYVTDSRLADRASSRRSDPLSQTPANKLALLVDDPNGPNKPGRVNQQVPTNVLTNPVRPFRSLCFSKGNSSSFPDQEEAISGIDGGGNKRNQFFSNANFRDSII